METKSTSEMLVFLHYLMQLEKILWNTGAAKVKNL
jgi:hypothetical protein